MRRRRLRSSSVPLREEPEPFQEGVTAAHAEDLSGWRAPGHAPVGERAGEQALPLTHPLPVHLNVSEGRRRGRVHRHVERQVEGHLSNDDDEEPLLGTPLHLRLWVCRRPQAARLCGSGTRQRSLAGLTVDHGPNLVETKLGLLNGASIGGVRQPVGSHERHVGSVLNKGGANIVRDSIYVFVPPSSRHRRCHRIDDLALQGLVNAGRVAGG
jgi:hypothetical protein